MFAGPTQVDAATIWQHMARYHQCCYALHASLCTLWTCRVFPATPRIAWGASKSWYRPDAHLERSAAPISAGMTIQLAMLQEFQWRQWCSVARTANHDMSVRRAQPGWTPQTTWSMICARHRSHRARFAASNPRAPVCGRLCLWPWGTLLSLEPAIPP